ncbi:MAG: sugar ABC transporter ATP-binding protein [Pleomorphochaeta sp.]
MPEVLSLVNIKKRFGGIEALKGVNFDLQEGEIHALLGENGAGKSTLIKIITGVHQANEGQIYLDNKLTTIDNPIEARKKGIGVIYQELSLIESLTVGENIFLGNEPSSKILGKYNREKMYDESLKYLNKFGIDINPREYIYNLRMGQKRIVEIVKALVLNAKILLLDEPTTGMSAKEIDTLFEIMDSLRNKKVTMIYISHYLDEVFRVCDRATVFRNGELIKTFEVSKTNTNELVKAMIGKNVVLENTNGQKNLQSKQSVIKVEDYKTSIMKEKLSFDVKESEILGITGIIGAGKSELANSLFGAAGDYEGNIFIKGTLKDINTTIKAKSNKMAFIPEDRKSEGLFLEDSIEENILRANIDLIEKKSKLLDKKLQTKLANQIAKDLELFPLDVKMQTKNLSGGNQQKVVIAKWLIGDPDIIIMDEPTRGIDVGAKSEIYNQIRNLSKNGKTIIVMSSEYDELLSVCDRILVLRLGKIVGELYPNKTSTQEILSLSLGGN